MGPPVTAAVLLSVAFPTWDVFPLAWVALVPLILQTQRAGARKAAGAFFLAGSVMSALVLRWLLVQVYWAGGWAVAGYP